MKKILFTLVFLFLMTTCFAEDVVDCSPIKLKMLNNTVLLQGSSSVSQLYFIRNNSKQGVWIDHPVLHPSASAGWSSYIRSGHWSVILVNRKDFAITCAVIEPGKVKYLDCTKAVTICYPKKIVIKKLPKATHWVVEDKSWPETINIIKKKY